MYIHMDIQVATSTCMDMHAHIMCTHTLHQLCTHVLLAVIYADLNTFYPNLLNTKTYTQCIPNVVLAGVLSGCFCSWLLLRVCSRWSSVSGSYIVTIITSLPNTIVHTLKVGGFKLPFLSVGGTILVMVIPCALAVRKISEFLHVLVFQVATYMCIM